MSEQRVPAQMTPAPTSDPFEWLEDIHGDEALAWVEAQNTATKDRYFDEQFEQTAAGIRTALDSDEQIPFVTKRGDYYYNVWRDADHPKGLWRRTTWDSYLTARPDWDVLLDIDELAAQEGTDWVYRGASLLRPDFDRALISLSPDGGDAVTVREFDLRTRSFVPAPEGFELPVAKTGASWIDRDSLLVSTDFGPGTLTSSSYPASVRVLARGAQLSDAVEVLRVPHDHMIAFGGVDHTPGFERVIVGDIIDFYHQRLSFAPLGEGRVTDAQFTDIDAPTDVGVDLDRELVLFRPRTDWNGEGFTVPAGALAVAKLDEFVAGTALPRVIFTPDASTSLQGWTVTANYLVLSLLTDVQCVKRVLDLRDDFAARDLQAPSANHTVSLAAVDPDDEDCGDDFWFTDTGFLTPTTLGRGTLKTAEAPTPIKSLPALFDASGLEVTQHFATSADGTHVPYFQIAAANLPLDGRNPVVLDGYGGFEISRLPAYAPATGIGWLSQTVASEPAPAAGVAVGRRGVYVVANIRGGGEYGPQWHTAALQQNRHRAYEDFAAVAGDLIARGVTTSAALACQGGSNGGLLVGNMLTQYPELFAAVSCGVPLLDMKRYIHLSAGTSWIAEYGDPSDPQQWEFIQAFSPYHLFDADRRDSYPEVLFWTATSDDRVGPVQARKMAAKMQEAGVDDVWFFEDTEGGHSAASDNKQAAMTRALGQRFLWRALTGQ